MRDDTVEIHTLTCLDRIAAEEWDACACQEAADGGRPDDPFTTHRFLKALEDS
ncbi:MAG: Peptidogalycan biosysnthesis/recognition, partial [Rhodobacteraceae bacterium HLUCCA24]